MRPPPWSIELRPGSLVALSAGLGPSAPRLTEPLGVQDWRETLDEIAAHRLNGLLVAAVADGTLPTTAEQRSEIARLEVELTRQQVWHDHRLAAACAALDAAGIEHRVLKGPAFGALDYPDRLMRPTSDLDILVRGADIRAAVDLLRGPDDVLIDPDPVPRYSELVGKSQTIARPDTLEIDLHRLLARGPFGLRVDPDDLWETSRPFTTGTSSHLTLGIEESVVHASLHLMILSERRAVSLRDLANLVAHPDLDHERLIELSRRWRVEIVVASAILQVDRHIGPAASAGGAALTTWAEELQPRSIDRCYLRIARPDDPIGPAEWPATLLALPSMRARGILLRSILAPAPGTNARFLERVAALVARVAHRR